MKGRVNTLLNIRTGSPRILPDNNPGYLKPNDIVTITGTLIGDNYKGNNIWYKLEDGGHVWSGGVNTGEAFDTAGKSRDINEWVKFLGLDNLAIKFSNQLKTIAITILDTGVDFGNEDLKGCDAAAKNFLFPNRNCNDFDGHGTYCAGIIAGTGAKRIIGGASGVKLNIGKVMSSSVPGLTGLTDQVLISALEWASDLSDVISISCGIPNYSPALHSKVREISGKNKIIVSAIGNVGQTGSGNYPAKFSECIAVGALNNEFNISDFTIRDTKIDICVPGENIGSTLPVTKQSYGTKSGTSISTPLVASIVAFKKLKNPTWDAEKIKSDLIGLSEKKNSNDFEYYAIKQQPIIL